MMASKSPPLPKEFLERLRSYNEQDYQQVIEACWNGTEFLKAPKTLLVIGDPALKKEVGEELESHGYQPQTLVDLPELEVALVLIQPQGKSLTELLSYQMGLIYAQEKNSFDSIVKSLFQLRKNWKAPRILDFCAAPGGKSILLSQAVRLWGGTLFVNEPMGARYQVLRENLCRCSALEAIHGSKFFHYQVPHRWHSQFDVMILDVPCSGEGLLRKSDEQGLEFWSVDRVLECAKTQKSIVEFLKPCLKQGGHLLYSTCTFSREENEEVVATLGSEFSTITAPIRYLPKKDQPGEGLFWGLFQSAHGNELEPTPIDLSLSEHLRCEGDRFFQKEEFKSPQHWPPLKYFHADAVRRHGKSLDLIDIEPTLQALQNYLKTSDLKQKMGRAEGVVWRHHVLRLELPLRSAGKFRVAYGI